MPLFMDRHDIDASPKAVADAHEKDLAVQEKHGVKYHNYWHDQARNCIFCLVEAPDKDAALQVHREAHGLVADDIIEVDPATVKAFFGDYEHAPSMMAIKPLQPDEPEQDTGFRAILFTDLEGSTDFTNRLGDEMAMELLRTHNGIVREKLKHHTGREIKHTGDGFMACFGSVRQAVECSMNILRAFQAHNRDNPVTLLRVRIGLSAGEPVEDNHDLFGATVQLAARLCAYAQPEQIIVSSVVQELCLGKKLPFKSHGEKKIKGFEKPLHLYEVDWLQVADA